MIHLLEYLESQSNVSHKDSHRSNKLSILSSFMLENRLILFCLTWCCILLFDGSFLFFIVINFILNSLLSTPIFRFIWLSTSKMELELFLNEKFFNSSVWEIKYIKNWCMLEKTWIYLLIPWWPQHSEYLHFQLWEYLLLSIRYLALLSE